jgi:uncharacterized membrane protein
MQRRLLMVELCGPTSTFSWLSLIPFASGWMGENHFAALPTAPYGVVPLMAALSYWILQTALITKHGKGSLLALAIGKDKKGKISPFLYYIAIGFTFLAPTVSCRSMQALPSSG